MPWIPHDHRNAEQQRLACKSQVPLSSLQAAMRGAVVERILGKGGAEGPIKTTQEGPALAEQRIFRKASARTVGYSAHSTS